MTAAYAPPQAKRAPAQAQPTASMDAPARPAGRRPGPGAPGVLQRKCACGETPGPDGECAACKRKRLALQRSFAGARREASHAPGDPIPQVVHDVLRSGGAPLDPPVRSAMEERFGHDFSRVRVHTDARAAASAAAVDAQAYTVGRDIVFADGRYSPRTPAGRRLLAHELAHVVQQRSGAFPASGGVLADGRWEAEAEAAAEAVTAGRPAQVARGAAQPQLSRQQARAAGEKVRPLGQGERVVTRFVTAGQCRRVPQTQVRPSGDITAQSAFFEVDLCRGRARGRVRGELNYAEAIDQIATALSTALPRALSAGPGAALDDLETAIRTATPEATIRLGGQWRQLEAEITATGRASIEAGPSGEATATVTVPAGPLDVIVSGTIRRGAEEEERITVSVGTPTRTREEPDCFTCVCGRPRIECHCADRPPAGEPEPPPPTQTLYVPLFFEYETAHPLDYAREGLGEATFEGTIAQIVERIREGYTIARIEGRTSPEGPLRRQRGGRFEGNIALAEARARAVEGRLHDAIRAALPLAMRSREQLSRALAGGYPVEGTAPGGGPKSAELFGSTAAGREVRERGLLGHLRERLRTPAEGEVDPLALERVIGEGVPPEIRAAVEARVAEFRAKIEAGTLTEADLERIFVPFRRAVVVLEPPAPRRLTAAELERATRQAAQAVVGTPVPCADEDRALFRGEPVPPDLLFEGECRSPEARPEPEGSP